MEEVESSLPKGNMILHAESLRFHKKQSKKRKQQQLLKLIEEFKKVAVKNELHSYLPAMNNLKRKLRKKSTYNSIKNCKILRSKYNQDGPRVTH